MKTPKNIVAIWGAPRSGTSWLGQIFNSSGSTLYRYQPLFSFEFKNFINFSSNYDDFDVFFNLITNSNNQFLINGLSNEKENLLLNFKKSKIISHLVIKHVRYHNLIQHFLKTVDNIKVIGIIRNPLAVINSWFNSPREFNPEWNCFFEEWQYAPKKNGSNIEEYYGFEKWKESSINFLKLKKMFPTKIKIIRYEELVSDTSKYSSELFDFVNLKMGPQSIKFIEDCHLKHNEHNYSVFKNVSVKDKWKMQLDDTIKEKIVKELKNTSLERFLMNKPLVSICCTTYNHSKFIKKALDSFIMQETKFKFEICIGEDYSDDNTRNICIEYAQNYPNIINLFLRDRKNTVYIDGYATGRFNLAETIKKCKGKYIAICEGDDFWTDSNKLQDQVDFLENNPEYVMIGSRVNNLQNEVILNSFQYNKSQEIAPEILFEQNPFAYLELCLETR